MSGRAAVFSCLGLGDGLISLTLSQNLELNGFSTTTFHPSLKGLQNWFPHLRISSFPKEEELLEVLPTFDRFFIFFEKTSWMQAIKIFCEKYFPEKTCIINPIATPNTNYPYWDQARFNGRQTFVENLFSFCQNILFLQETTKSNGIKVPKGIIPRRFPKRIVIHPTSSRPGKNWSQEKFIDLAKLLHKKGFDPAFILTIEEKKGWEIPFDIPEFASLSDLAAFVCESGYMIGNDSGIGHLASCLGLPTVTICRSKVAANFWRPSWSCGAIVLPPSWIPNLKGLRLRDKYWKKSISLTQVMKALESVSAFQNS